MQFTKRMKVYSLQSRPDYLNTQIKRSRQKFGYCKVSAKDPLHYFRIINHYCHYHGLEGVRGPVLCLGVRNGREVDLFRAALTHPALGRIISATELPIQGFRSPLDFIASLHRSRTAQPHPPSVLGVEINPTAARSDIWIGSFDDMPSEWEDSFPTVYSNSFDHAQDPRQTVQEWLRVTKPGGFLIITFDANKSPTKTDPVGGLTLKNILNLFNGNLIYYNAQGTVYAEAIIQKPES